jgi:hypothetical protein
MDKPITTVLCKKYFRNGGKILFGEYHEGVQYNNFFLEERIGDGPDMEAKLNFEFIYIYNQNGNGGHRFRLNKIDNRNEYMPYFFDYFYNNQELRKFKLQKITNENL